MTLVAGAALSEHPVASTAAGEVIGQVLEAVGREPDVACLFVTSAHLDALAAIAHAVRSLLAPGALAGCGAVGVIGGPQEVEGRPGIALWAARTGRARPVRLDAVRSGDGWGFGGLPTDLPSDEPATLLVLADPTSFPTDAFVDACHERLPAVTVAGGLASASTARGGNRLVLDEVVHDDGAVGLLLPARAVTRVVVSQGCRPVGDPLIITRAAGNVLEELAGRPALERVQALVDAAPDEERRLLALGLHLGVVVDERKERFGRGDFLVRSVLGADRASGSIVLGEAIPVGTTVQFHVRDARTADEDLRALMLGEPGDAALVFTCNGRGERFFGEPDHDASVVHGAVGRGAVAGMFCAGEIGPVGDRAFVHGSTASVVVFRGTGHGRAGAPS
jgi:small ligand-binding sensory domain FIST